MRITFIVLLTIFSLESKAQTILTGTLEGVFHKNTLPKTSRILLLHNDSIDESSFAIAENGKAFSLSLPPVDSIDIIVEYHYCTIYAFKNIPIKKNNINDIGILKINLSNRPTKCPIDSTDKVIPVAYGLIRDKEFLKEVDKGKVHLGGCELPPEGCETLYCSRHKIRF